MKQSVRKNIEDRYKIDDTKSSSYILLLDMNSIMKMCLVDKRVATNGLECGMVFQTLLQIRQMLIKKTWSHVYAFYDGDGSGVLRYQFYKDYKANRDKHYDEISIGKNEYDRYLDDYVKRVLSYSRKKKMSQMEKECPNKARYEDDSENFQRQREILFKILEEVFFRQVMCDNVEGDDLIAYYVKNKKENEKIIIVSSDRDLTQLISDSVSVYIPKLKKFITPSNSKELLGCPSCNILLKKQICGDASDNIAGIKGLGEATLYKVFPRILEEKVGLNDFLEEAKKINEDRKNNKKKPLKCLENALNRITDGSQGNDIYNINEKIIDLSSPLLTDEAISELDYIMESPIDPSGRSFENIYKIIVENGISDLINDTHFSSFFSPFNSIVDEEKKFFKKSNENI